MAVDPSLNQPAPAEGRRRQTRLLLPPVGLALAGALVLAGCSSDSSSSPTTTTTTAAPTTTTTTAAPTTTTTTAAPTTTTTQATTTTCQPNQLQITPQQGQGAAGTISMTVSLMNTSSTTCTLSGYPGMQLLANGSPIPTNVVRGGGQFSAAAANQAPSTVTLAHGATATFALSYEDVPVGNETSCPTSSQAEITPPNDTGYAVVTLQIAPCNNGTIHVSPVYVG